MEFRGMVRMPANVTDESGNSDRCGFDYTAQVGL